MARELWQMKPPALPPISRYKRHGRLLVPHDAIVDSLDPVDPQEEGNRELSELLRSFDLRYLLQEEF